MPITLQKRFIYHFKLIVHLLKQFTDHNLEKNGPQQQNYDPKKCDRVVMITRLSEIREEFEMRKRDREYGVHHIDTQPIQI